MKIQIRLAALAAVVALTSCSGPVEQLAGGLLTDHRKAQDKTVKDIRDTGGAMFGWLTDHVGAAAAGQQQVSLEEYVAITPGELRKLLVPEYLPDIPEKDGWGHPYEHYFNSADLLGPKVMGIRSPGRDGKVSANVYTVAAFDADEVDSDIVWVDGFFVAWPEGDEEKKPRAPTWETVLGDGKAKDRTAQKQTLDDMRKTGMALYGWLTDQVGAAAAGQDEIVSLLEYHPLSYREVSTLLVPSYLPVVPERDGWGHPYEYRVNVDALLGRRVLFLRSPGRDGRFSADSYVQDPFDPDDFDRDIVWADGFFLQWPERRKTGR